MRDDESPGRATGFRTTRTEAFSDGVFAIAITLLVLEIGGALVDQWPSYLAYIVSFASIGAVWFAHTVITEFLHHTTQVFARVNLLLTSLLVSALWRYAIHAGLVRRDLAEEDVTALTRRLTPGLAGYVVMIVLGLFVPVIAVVGYFAIAVFILVPFHHLRRRTS